MIGVRTWWILVLLPLGCGGDEKTPLGRYPDTCLMTIDCAEPLMCVNGMCTAACTSDTDCKAYSSTGSCVGANVSTGYCYDLCMDAVECTKKNPDLTCTMATTMQGTCRPRP